MKDLNKKAFAGLLRLLVGMAVLIFLPAWTLDYWQAWIFLIVFSVVVLAITAYLMKKDPGLLERRIRGGPKAEKEKSQKIIQVFAQIAFIAVIVFPAIDHHFAWSTVPTGIALTGDVFVGIGLLIVFFVFRENTFASGIIETSTDQKIVSTGPYSIVRHPMYIGALVMLFGVPLALGSWWGLVLIIPITVVIVWRLLDEEKYLAKNLPGYTEYQKKVRYCLLPFIW